VCLLGTLGLLPAESPVEAGVDIDVPSVGLLAAPCGGTTNRDVKSSLARSELLAEETAVGTETLARLLEVSSLELDAAALVQAEQGEESTNEAELAVDFVLLLGVSSAERRIIGTGESLLAHAVTVLVVELGATVLGLAAAGRSRRSVGLLVVTVGTGNDNLEAVTALSCVGSCFLGNLLSPERALVVDSGRRLFARALVRVPLRVTFNVDVEASASLGAVAELTAGSGVVAVEGRVRDVAVTGGSTLEVDERLLVGRRSAGTGGELSISCVVQKSSDGIIDRGNTLARRLRSAWVVGVDEAAVCADLNIGSASGVRGESVGVDPVNGSAGRGNQTISSRRSLCALCSGRSRCNGSGSSSRSRGGDRLGSRVCVVLLGLSRLCVVLLGLGPRPPEGASLELFVVDAPLGSLSGSSTCGGGSSSSLSGALDVSSLLSRANTDRRALGEGSRSIKTVGVESLGSWVGSDEGSSPENDGVTHSERSRYKTCVKKVKLVVAKDCGVETDGDEYFVW
jgi:hypothetical protein